MLVATGTAWGQELYLPRLEAASVTFGSQVCEAVCVCQHRNPSDLTQLLHLTFIDAKEKLFFFFFLKEENLGSQKMLASFKI